MENREITRDALIQINSLKGYTVCLAVQILVQHPSPVSMSQKETLGWAIFKSSSYVAKRNLRMGN